MYQQKYKPGLNYKQGHIKFSVGMSAVPKRGPLTDLIALRISWNLPEATQ